MTTTNLPKSSFISFSTIYYILDIVLKINSKEIIAMKNTKKWKILIFYWLPVLLIAGGIFYSSSTPYGKQDIRPQISQLKTLYDTIGHFDFIHFKYAGTEISIDKLGVAGFTEFLIRKLTHFSVFLLLSFFTTRLASLYVKRFFLIGLLGALLYAALDEFHQSFTVDRTPLVQDVVIDSMGAIVGASFFILIYKKNIKMKRH
jgi:VanZ family protein